MDRRTKQRLDLRLVCRIGSSKLLSAAVSPADLLVTENFSRNGILLRWLSGVELPSIGSRLTVDVDLPCTPGRVPRVMRCDAEVVRLERCSDPEPLIGLTIGKIRFARRDRESRPAAAADLENLPPATSLVN
jgi:hypothetical protein